MAASGNSFIGLELATAAAAAAAAEGCTCYGSSSQDDALCHHHFGQIGNFYGHGLDGGVLVPSHVDAAGGSGGRGFLAPAGGFAGVGPYYAGGAAHFVLPVLTSQQQPPPPPPAAAEGESDVVLVKGAWTKEEDQVLRQMVAILGDRKWAAVARYLPGRIGKQCRERWINHLHPGIKKSAWTEDEDMALIAAHRSCGNRWSVIARHLPGRSENAVKNHWNATKRSLKTRLRLRKLAPPFLDELPLLAEYIHSVSSPPSGEDDAVEEDGAAVGDEEEEDDDAVSYGARYFTAPPSPPPPVPTSPPSVAAAAGWSLAAGSSDVVPAPAAAGWSLAAGSSDVNPALAAVTMPDLVGPYRGGQADGPYSYFFPPYAPMNLHYGMPPPPPPEMVGDEHVGFHAAAYAFPNPAAGMGYGHRESSSSHAYHHHHHHGEAEAGPSNSGGGDQPRRDQGKLSLDLARFR